MANENNEVGEYTKKEQNKKQTETLIYERVKLNQQVGLKQTKENLFLFTRITEEHNLNYSVGYFLDEKEVIKQYSAFLFFFPNKGNNKSQFYSSRPIFYSQIVRKNTSF